MRHADRLIVTADDFGLAAPVNEAVEIAHREGILSAASLMVGAPAAADALRRARRMPGLRVGLHLVLVDGRPMLPRGCIPGLVDRDGQLRRDLGALSVALACSESLRRQLAAEIETQFEAFRATGLALDHVNAHRHFHLHPVVCRLVLQIGRAFGLRALRVPFEPVETVRRAGGRARSVRAETTMSMHLRHRAAGAAVIMPDALLGLRWSGALTPPRLAALLRVRPPGLVEVYTHPATGTSFDGAAPGYRYRDELDALCDPACRESLGSRIRPCGYADITPATTCICSAPARLT